MPEPYVMKVTRTVPKRVRGSNPPILSDPKKTGGTKITYKTEPKKNFIFYAQWSKNNNSEKTNISHPIVGVWSKTIIPFDWANILYNKYDTGAREVSETIWKSGSSGGGIFVDTFRADRTGFSVYVATDSYGWTTFNYHVTGDTIYKTNIVGTNYDKSIANFNYEKKSFEDSNKLFKIRAYEGKQQICIKPSFKPGSEMDKMTIDEYIEKGSPEWYTKYL